MPFSWNQRLRSAGVGAGDPDTTKPARLVLPSTQVVTNRKLLYEERILRLLRLGTKNGGGGEFKKKQENGMGSHYGPQECGTKPLQLYCALEANAHTLAANSRLNSHILQKYMNSSFQPQNEKWFLRM